MTDSAEEPTAPAWFQRAVAATPEVGQVDCRGCAINYLAWGSPGDPGLIFVHGGAAHAHWWSFLVPLLADQYRVVAIDRSGHGDSGRRDAYSLDDWSAEVMAVAGDAQIGGKPVVVGHSMGGFVSIATAAEYGDDLAGVIIIESPVTTPDAEATAASYGLSFGPLRVYETAEDALDRFRTVPRQKQYLDYVLDHVKRHSLRAVDGGYSWKYDPKIFDHDRTDRPALLRRVTCRVALFRAEFGLVTPEIGDFMYDLLGRAAPVVEIPQASHHPMLDQPLLLLTALRTLLADWEHSRPLTTRR